HSRQRLESTSRTSLPPHETEEAGDNRDRGRERDTGEQKKRRAKKRRAAATKISRPHPWLLSADVDSACASSLAAVLFLAPSIRELAEEQPLADRQPTRPAKPGRPISDEQTDPQRAQPKGTPKVGILSATGTIARRYSRSSSPYLRGLTAKRATAFLIHFSTPVRPFDARTRFFSPSTLRSASPTSSSHYLTLPQASPPQLLLSANTTPRANAATRRCLHFPSPAHRRNSTLTEPPSTRGPVKTFVTRSSHKHKPRPRFRSRSRQPSPLRH
ncbi:hypothetical protein TARUN_8048, partial [Trichoderma arundinaceum]